MALAPSLLQAKEFASTYTSIRPKTPATPLQHAPCWARGLLDTNRQQKIMFGHDLKRAHRLAHQVISRAFKDYLHVYSIWGVVISYGSRVAGPDQSMPSKTILLRAVQAARACLTGHASGCFCLVKLLVVADQCRSFAYRLPSLQPHS